MAPCSGRQDLPICICGRIALLGEREHPTECERAGTEGQDEEAQAEEKDRAREVAAAGVDRAPRWRCRLEEPNERLRSSIGMPNLQSVT